MSKRAPKAARKTESVHKEIKLQIRLDDELYEAARHKAERYGGISPVIRALLRRWIKEELVTAEDVLAEISRAPYRRHKQ